MNRYSLSLLIAVSLIFAMGLLMVFNTTSAEVLDRSLDRSTHHALIKHIVDAAMACIAFLLVWWVGYQKLIQMSGMLLIAATVLLVLVFVPGIGQQINGAHRWIGIFGNSFQPSEFAKILIPIYCISALRSIEGPVTLSFFLRLIGKISIPIGLILIEPDNGTVAILFAALIALFFLARVKWLYWALPLLVLSFCGALIASQMPHVSSRIKIYMHPESDLKGKGHQPHQAKIAAGSGGLTGRGLGESLQKLDYLPEARSDYIAAIYAEEFGFLGVIALIMLYMGIGFFGFSLASKSRDLSGFYLVSVLTFLICFQAFLNLGIVSGLLPSKGTNLPFFSKGGSSLIANFIALSLMINVAYQAQKKKKEEIHAT